MGRPPALQSSVGLLFLQVKENNILIWYTGRNMQTAFLLSYQQPQGFGCEIAVEFRFQFVKSRPALHSTIDAPKNFRQDAG